MTTSTASGRADTGATSRTGPSQAPASRPYYLRAGSALLEEKAGEGEQPESRFTFDPKDPVPTMGGRPLGGRQRYEGRRLRPARRTPRLHRLQGHDAAELPGRRAELSDAAPGGRPGGHGARGDAPLGLVVGARHRLHGEARGRLPAGRRLSRRPRHQHHRLDQSAPGTATATTSPS